MMGADARFGYPLLRWIFGRNRWGICGPLRGREGLFWPMNGRNRTLGRPSRKQPENVERLRPCRRSAGARHARRLARAALPWIWRLLGLGARRVFLGGVLDRLGRGIELDGMAGQRACERMRHGRVRLPFGPLRALGRQARVGRRARRADGGWARSGLPGGRRFPMRGCICRLPFQAWARPACCCYGQRSTEAFPRPMQSGEPSRRL